MTPTPELQQSFPEWDERGPVPGVYEDVPEQVYHTLPLCSGSNLKRAANTSFRQLRYELDRKELPTSVPKEPLRLGSAIHVLTLQPQDSGRVVEFPDLRGNRRLQALDHYINGNIPLGKGAALVARQAVEALKEPEFTLVREALEYCNERELTVVFDYRGVRAKCRLDAVSRKAGMLLDVKTGQSSEDQLAGKLDSLMYDLSAALYLAAANDQLREPDGPEFDCFAFVTVSTELPIEFGLHRASEELCLEPGRMRLNSLVDRWRHCEETGVWPPRYTEEREVGHRPYVLNRIMGSV